MKKYWHVIGIGIQNNLTYRVNYLARTLFSFIPLFAMLSLWRTICAGKEQGSAFQRKSRWDSRYAAFIPATGRRRSHHPLEPASTGYFLRMDGRLA